MITQGRLTIAAVIAIAWAASASAAIRQIPPVATNETPVTLIMYYASCDGHRGPLVKRNGFDIEVHLFGTGCVFSEGLPHSVKVALGTLAPGNHNVTFFKESYTEKTTVVVHDVTTFAVVPSGGQVGVPQVGNGQYVHTPLGINLNDQFVVWFGSQEGDLYEHTIGLPVPATEGVVDVTVVRDDVTTVARNAFTWTSKVCTDPRIWERVLIPIQFDGPGAHGSLWRTSFDIATISSLPAYPYSAPPYRGELCELRQLDDSRPKHVPAPGDGVRGYFLYVPRSLVPAFRFALSVQEISRAADALPVAIPVPREIDWKFGHSSVVNIPPLKNARATLRVYGLDEDFDSLYVRYVKIDGTQPTRKAVVARYGADEPKFASIDVSDLLDPNSSRTLTLSGQPEHSRYWAMLTLTDNDTQRFVVFTPQ